MATARSPSSAPDDDGSNGGTVINVFHSSGPDTKQADAMGRVTQFTTPTANQIVYL